MQKHNQPVQDQFIDYKNVEFLKRFTNPHARIVSKRRSAVSAKQQRLIAESIKHARFMALMPYILK